MTSVDILLWAMYIHREQEIITFLLGIIILRFYFNGLEENVLFEISHLVLTTHGTSKMIESVSPCISLVSWNHYSDNVT